MSTAALDLIAYLQTITRTMDLTKRPDREAEPSDTGRRPSYLAGGGHDDLDPNADDATVRLE